MFAVLLIFAAMPQVSPSLTSMPQVSKSLTESPCGVCVPGNQCGCLDGNPCLCRKHKSYAEWKAAVSKKRAVTTRSLAPHPITVLPGWGTPPARPMLTFGGTFSSFAGACAGGG
jgi:hypothetical protein